MLWECYMCSRNFADVQYTSGSWFNSRPRSVCLRSSNASGCPSAGFFAPKVSDELNSHIEALQVHRKINSERLEIIRKQHESSRIWCKVSTCFNKKHVDLFPDVWLYNALHIFRLLINVQGLCCHDALRCSLQSQSQRSQYLRYKSQVVHPELFTGKVKEEWLDPTFCEALKFCSSFVLLYKPFDIEMQRCTVGRDSC